MEGTERPGSRGRAVVIRGPLGVGKTTVAAELARRLGGRVVSIDGILQEHDLEEWKDDYISEGSFLKANEFAVAEAREPLRRGGSVVFDGNFYWRSVIDDLASRLGLALRTYTLAAPLYVCIERDRTRAVPLGAESAVMVHAKTTGFEYGTRIDATRPIDEVVGAILADLLG